MDAVGQYLVDFPGDAGNQDLRMLNPQNTEEHGLKKMPRNYVSMISKSSASKDVLIQYVYCANKDFLKVFYINYFRKDQKVWLSNVS